MIYFEHTWSIYTTYIKIDNLLIVLKGYEVMQMYLLIVSLFVYVFIRICIFFLLFEHVTNLEYVYS